MQGKQLERNKSHSEELEEGCSENKGMKRVERKYRSFIRDGGIPN
jgi:hypothetical protein